MTTATSTGPDAVAARVDEVRARIARACAASGRRPADVQLVAVSKTHPPAAAQAMVDAGVADLGENRVRELLDKRPHVTGARWHFVGQLQSRKARDVVGAQVLVHSVDRRSLADALSRRAGDAGAVQRILVQVNVGDDPAKGGCDVDGCLDLVAYARDLPNLAVEGLMTVPPLPPGHADGDVDEDEGWGEAARPHFARLRRLRDDARARWPEVVHLSMGMSADLEVAIAEGATMVRVGTALFGPRGDSAWTSHR
ncbi:MAG: YggS family pyridoxal phosphate-dependent enzyme [Actinobacteria bacterium]|nr:YggS family pyridoxal phosphate-dependent enzyme [Actinomycetota bacterium]